MNRVFVVSVLAFVLAIIPGLGHAEEGGSGHYFPGSMASFIDGVSPVPTFIVRLNLTNYDGSFGAQRQFPIAGLIALDADVDLTAAGLTLFWRPTWGGIGKQWSYGMSATIPLLDLKVNANVSREPGDDVLERRSDTESGLGDIVLLPLMLNYQHSSDLNVDFRIGLYAPTGDYEVGRLANPGKNFWTVEPTVAVIYLGQHNGREASLFLGTDFNQENPDTNYKSGTQAHLDGTLAQHLRLWGGTTGFGVTGFWYRQVTDDSGEGAKLGGFRAQANGFGPVVSYVRKFRQSQLLAEFKWLREFDNQNRPEGDTLFLKIIWNFAGPSGRR